MSCEKKYAHVVSAYDVALTANKKSETYSLAVLIIKAHTKAFRETQLYNAGYRKQDQKDHW